MLCISNCEFLQDTRAGVPSSYAQTQQQNKYISIIRTFSAAVVVDIVVVAAVG